MDNSFFESLCVSNVAVMSGIRPKGRMIDRSDNGRPKHCLLYIFSGETTFFVGNKKTVASEKELIYIPKGQKYQMEYSADSTTFVLIDFDAFDKSGSPISLFGGISAVAKDDASNRIARIMTNFELCGTSKNLASCFRRKELIYKLFGVVFSMEASNNEEQGDLTKIIKGVLLLEQTYIEDLPISEFAKEAHVSIGTFRTTFNRHYKMSPLQYRNHLRIARARELLSEGSFTVSEAAYASGFENIGYFCRLYKRIVGESPSETKKRV